MEIFEQIDLFIKDNKRSSWLYSNEVKVYVRKSKRLIGGSMVDVFDLASVEVEPEHQQKGIFNQVVNYMIENNPYEWFQIENANNPIIVSYCKKRNFKEFEIYPLCFFFNV